VASEAAVAFDPRVVGILQRRYVEWEHLARLQPMQTPPKLSTDVRVERGLARDAGFAQCGGVSHSVLPAADFFERLATARQQARNLNELTRGLSGLLSLDDILS